MTGVESMYSCLALAQLQYNILKNFFVLDWTHSCGKFDGEATGVTSAGGSGLQCNISDGGTSGCESVLPLSQV